VIDLVHGWKSENCEVTFQVDKRTSNGGAQGEKSDTGWMR
jgi:hypothetical protein